MVYCLFSYSYCFGLYRPKRNSRNQRVCNNLDPIVILERDEKILSQQQKKNLWVGKNCLNCVKITHLCAICKHPIPSGNLLLPVCQHTFCRICLHKYLDETSSKYETWPWYKNKDHYLKRLSALHAGLKCLM